MAIDRPIVACPFCGVIPEPYDTEDHMPKHHSWYLHCRNEDQHNDSLNLPNNLSDAEYEAKTLGGGYGELSLDEAIELWNTSASKFEGKMTAKPKNSKYDKVYLVMYEPIPDVSVAAVYDTREGAQGFIDRMEEKSRKYYSIDEHDVYIA